MGLDLSQLDFDKIPDRDKLLFREPEFSGGGIQITVRNGHKWDDIVTHLPFLVDVYETGREDKILGEACIVGKMITRVCDLPPSLLALEHSPSCRDRFGLCQAMQNAYGPDWDPYNDDVTVLFFEYYNHGDDPDVDPAGGDA